MASTTDVLPPRYADATLIASGGMGRVFHATDSELDRDVAVKVLADGYADNEDVRGRFRREAQASARLRHPNVVEVYASDFEGDTHYLAMECIRLDRTYAAALTILIPFDADADAYQQLNAVIASVKPVGR